jgi:hypothetical protein
MISVLNILNLYACLFKIEWLLSNGMLYRVARSEWDM